MKLLLLCTLVGLCSTQLWAQFAVADAENIDLLRLNGQRLERSVSELALERILLDEQMSEQKVFQRAKLFLLRGQVELARVQLDNFERGLRISKLRPVLTRYRAVADFLQGRYVNALQELENPLLNSSRHYRRICTLKVLLKVMVRDRKHLASEWDRCRTANFSAKGEGDMLWMTTMVKLVTTPQVGIAETSIKNYGFKNLSNEDLRRLLKLALYLNMEALVVKNIDELDYSVVEDDDLRTLLGMVLYRQGEFERAYKFVFDIENPNANVIKGSLAVNNGRLETGYAFFLLALEQKKNSLNAAERAIPLSWLLKQWGKGLELADVLEPRADNQQQRQAVAAAFAVQLEQFSKARSYLDRITRVSGESTALEVDQLYTYVALRTKDPKALAKHGQRACAAGDMTYCWLMMAQTTWEDVSLFFDNDELTVPKINWARQLAANSDKPTAFKEDVYVDQRDIDELDEGLIKLIKN